MIMMMMKWIPKLGLAIGLVVFGMLASLFWIYTADDAYIVFRFAANLANGHGIVWNKGGLPAEGYTSTSYLLLAALVQKIGLSPALAFKWLGVLFTLLTAALLYRIASEMTGSRLGASWTFAIYLISPTVAFQAIHAMETPLFILLLILTFFFSLKAVKPAPAFHQREWVFAGASCFLAGLTRPEGFFFDGLVLVFMAVYLLCKHWSPGLAWSIVKSLTASLFIPFAAYLSFKYFYFSDLLPTTFYAKYSASFVNSGSLSRLWMFWREVALIFITVYLIEILGTYLYDTIHSSSEGEDKGHDWAGISFAAGIIICVTYLKFAPQMDIVHRFRMPAYPFFVLASAPFLNRVLRLIGLARARFQARALSAIALVVISIWPLYSTLLSTWGYARQFGYANLNAHARVARIIANHPDIRGRWLMATSAGVIPYSAQNWNAVETYPGARYFPATDWQPSFGEITEGEAQPDLLAIYSISTPEFYEDEHYPFLADNRFRSLYQGIGAWPYVRERNSWLKVYARNGINDPEWSALVNELSSESGKFAYEPVPALYSFYQQHLSRFSGIIYSLPH